MPEINFEKYTKPLVSIALRSYNQKEYLKQSIDSILAQTFHNFELIIADDASIDGSQEMILEYARKYPKLIKPILAKQNGGHTVNMNRALSACSAKYISIFDGDDIMRPQKLEKQVDYMESHPKCSVCYHNTEYFDNETGKFLYFKNNQNNSYQGKVEVVIRYGSYFNNISTLIRRDKIPEYGCNSKITIASDWLFYVETLINGGEIHYLDAVLANVRRHNENVTKRNRFKTLSDHIKSAFLIARKYPKYRKQALIRIIEGAVNQFNPKLYK